MAINTEPTNEGYTILQGVNKIIELLEGGGGSLPEVTDADNGKVLTVIDGAWAAGPGGGGGGLLVHVIMGDDSDSLDKNWNEINTAVQAGIMPVIIGETGVVYSLSGISNDDDGYYVDCVVSGDIRSFSSDSATGVLTYAL